MERLPTLLDEVGTLPPELMPDNFDGVKFLMNLEAEGLSRAQRNDRISRELTRRAINHEGMDDCYICREHKATYDAYVERFPIE